MKYIQSALLAAAICISPAALAGSSSSSGSSEEHHYSGSNGKQVPELDAGTAGLSLSLLLAVTALMRERRKQN